MPRLSTPVLHQLFPVAGRRVLVIDPGSSSVKVLVAESTLGHTQVLHHQTIEIESDIPESPINPHALLGATLPKLGQHLVALVLPQHRAISSTVDVPQDPAADPRRFLEAEARKLSGLSEDAFFHGAIPIEPFGRLRNPHFLTLCKRAEVNDLIDRCLPPADPGQPQPDPVQVTEVATTAQALFAALEATPTPPEHAILVDLGAENTVVALWLEGRGVYATSFEGGSRQFTAAVAADSGQPQAAAESAKRAYDFLSAATPNPSPACRRAVAKWYGDLNRAVAEWLNDYPELKIPLASIPVFLSGGGAAQPGLLGYLDTLGPLRFLPWPEAPRPQPRLPAESYRVAYGAARIALGLASPTFSLLPPEFQRVRQHRHWWSIAQSANVLLLFIIAFALLFATWQKIYLHSRKTQLIAQAQAALHSASNVAQLAQRLDLGYTSVGPLFLRQQQSLQTLAAFNAVRTARTNNDFWLLLFADALTYRTGSTQPKLPTNAPPAIPAAALTPAPTNAQFVAEICIPQEGDRSRRILNQFVSDLKRNPLFARVDVLPPERKRNLVDPRVYVTNRVFAVSLEIAMPAVSNANDPSRRPAASREPRRVLPPVRPRPAPLPVAPKPSDA